MNLLQDIAFQLARALMQAFAIMVIVFLLVRVTPGDVVDVLAIEGDLTAEQQEVMREELGLDRPLVTEFFNWVRQAATGDLGQSLRYGRPVADMVGNALPTTLTLAASSFIIGLVLAFSTALTATMTQGRFTTSLVNLLNIWSIAFPTFCVGVAAILVFSIWLGWLPVLGAMIAPVVIIGIDNAGQIAKPLFEELREAANSAHVRTARAKGLHPVRIAIAYLLPTAIPIALALSGLILAGLVAGTLTMEVLFGLSGIGSLTLQAIHGRDYPVVQGAVVVIALGIVAINTVMDILHRLIDPRLAR
ncbi:ABC transporter permease [Billgrantia endophytica]|uniref:ABC transporter permease n=1 Tax=Billgrantia endophytica TaxID=2033802 RepID=A0A2N7UAG3_9GAMM|nr:ABC transporter permease [Halomonas endophytica]PMR77395.1 ABC transporter permease [Halomonas endophytica]